jgi:hypothetical protein
MFVPRYVRCDTCRSPMEGIFCPSARQTCHGCGGQALIGDRPARQDLVRRARARLGRCDPPTNPRPYRPEVA